MLKKCLNLPTRRRDSRNHFEMLYWGQFCVLPRALNFKVTSSGLWFHSSQFSYTSSFVVLNISTKMPFLFYICCYSRWKCMLQGLLSSHPSRHTRPSEVIHIPLNISHLKRTIPILFPWDTCSHFHFILFNIDRTLLKRRLSFHSHFFIQKALQKKLAGIILWCT